MKRREVSEGGTAPLSLVRLRVSATRWVGRASRWMVARLPAFALVVFPGIRLPASWVSAEEWPNAHFVRFPKDPSQKNLQPSRTCCPMSPIFIRQCSAGIQRGMMYCEQHEVTQARRGARI